jgi:solute carrier family 66 (lysosomal lysine-arginine transporter), member 1
VGREGSDRGTWAVRAAPFWLGAAGVLVLDAAMGVQFIVFGDGKARDEGVAEVLVVEEVGVRGPNRWRRVSGWMRGWMPVAGSKRAKRIDESGFDTATETDAETESLLSVRTGDDASSVRSYGTTR